MTEQEFLGRYPRLWHMAADGSWPSIQKRGLLSTAALLDLYGVEGAEREAIFSKRRPQCVTVTASGMEDAVIRDQKPMTDSALTKCLTDGLSPRDWYETLNAMTFFWVSKDRLLRLLNARAYRKIPQVILTVDAATLLRAHAPRVRLARINSGATLYTPQPRGKDTFRSIASFPSKDKAIELTVQGGVLDVVDHTLTAHRYANGAFTELWRSERAASDDGF